MSKNKTHLKSYYQKIIWVFWVCILLDISRCICTYENKYAIIELCHMF